MPVCMIVDNPDQTQEQTERALAHVRSTGSVPPEGARLLFGGPAEPGWRFVSVWDSQEALDRFVAERYTPAYEAAGIPMERARRSVFELHTLVAGDLTGAPQPA